MKGLLAQDSGGRELRDDAGDLPAPAETLSRSAEAVGEGALVDVFVPRGGRVGSAFTTWISKARDATIGAVALRAEWPPAPGAAADASELPVPLEHPLLEISSELRAALVELAADLGVSPLDGAPDAAAGDAGRTIEGFPAEAPLVQFARGAELLDRALEGAVAIGQRRTVRGRAVALAARQALDAYRSLKAASDLMNEVRLAAYSLEKLT